MAATAAEALKEMNARFLTLSKAAPQVFGAFRNLMTESSKDGLYASGYDRPRDSQIIDPFGGIQQLGR